MGTIKNLGPVLKPEDIFQEDDYGKPISEKLSEALRRNVNKNDYANIAIRSNVSFSTIRDVVYRTNSLTKVNANAILLLIHAAYENSIAYRLRAEGDMLYLNGLLKF
ncbi:hypothetical protein [Flagellimonas nanhaiensis]|uniref:Uncharacterized protein n=1 Tax=Flagellimonas nanhaiensis TaxID=2292706 RepID=A0A371JQU7_9FLAO|nr:hypothetical protein [Allomuricauda nanhaiensis]RDY59891.1 hypothetical protein DX873_11105 [Allomuricauda nanhaiensis]